MTTALVVVTDGRGEYLERCARAAETHALGPFDQFVMVDDSGDFSYGEWLAREFPHFELCHHPQRRGLAASVQSAWAMVTTEYVFHLEEDFVLLEGVPLGAMRRVLNADQSLAQVVLKRNPWSPVEIAAGGQMECDPRAYTEIEVAGYPVTVHQPDHPSGHVFSLNPCLIPRRVFADGWPDGNEEAQTYRVKARGLRLAYWGGITDPPVCEHIGAQRSAGWLL